MFKLIVSLIVALFVCMLVSAHVAGTAGHAFTLPVLNANITWIMVIFMGTAFMTHRAISGKH